MAEGKDLLDAAILLVNNHKKEDGEQKAATKALNDAINDANKKYIPHLKVARIAFRNDSNRNVQLELAGSRKESQSGWLRQTNVFYANLLTDEDALATMLKYGQTTEKLQAGLRLVNKAEELLAVRKKEMGEAQESTKVRDKAIDDLQEWYSDYIEIARLAVSDQPQYLEMLGIVQHS
ncbi:hypothetical protein E9993_05200 [Labilibacter sediminis]|nr:hypothetical protein E9993_05200 [Labilibacter sediminis]